MMAAATLLYIGDKLRFNAMLKIYAVQITDEQITFSDGSKLDKIAGYWVATTRNKSKHVEIR